MNRKLTDINNLIGYDAIIFPSMADVNTAQLPAIMSTLTSAVYNYHIGIITAGDFLTNDQTGAALPGNPYANMETLLGLARYAGGNSGAVTVTANDVTNPIMKGYTAGQVIQTYASEGYTAYQAVGGTATDVLVNQNVYRRGHTPRRRADHDRRHQRAFRHHGSARRQQPVVERHPERRARHAARCHTAYVPRRGRRGRAHGHGPVAVPGGRVAGRGRARHLRHADTDPPAVEPAIRFRWILLHQHWRQPDRRRSVDNELDVSLPYYKALLAMGSEIGTHSYTHLINPPTTTITETTVGDTPAGSSQITLSALPSFAGVTVGMFVTGLNLGTNTPLPGAAGEGGAVANTQVTAVSGNTITISYVPDGFGGVNDGTLGAIPAGTTLTFSIPAENTNFLQTGDRGAVTSAVGDPFTYDYEFNQSKLLEQTNLGTTIYGAAIPGANETFATDQNILPYYQSVAATATTPGYTGYLTGGWTGIGSGYPSAIGYMSPSATDTGALYIAPNMTFDFTEIQYQGKTVAQAEADWAAQFNALTANAAGTPVVVLPVHDYGVAAWNTTTDTGTGSPYTTQMYTDFIANAYADNYEFLTLEELAARTVAQQKAAINYTTLGNTITATVTPDPTAPDVGGMALDVVNGGTNVIQNVTNWYAYNAQELFLPTHGGTFTINLGATQDNVTHIASLPMRGDLLSVTGDGLNLSFSMFGAGDVIVDLSRTSTPTVTGATIKSLVGNVLDLSLTGLSQHDVTINLLARVTSVAFSADTGSSATDLVTNIAAQTISGVLSGPLGAGDVVQVSLDNGATWLTATATAAAGGMAFSLTGVVLTGSNTLLARVGSAAGAFSTPLSQAYVLDQIAPAVPSVPDLTAASDSGVSNTDNITNVTTPSFTGTAEAGSIVTLLDGASVIGTTVATGGTWTITASTLAAGSHSIAAEATDLAGNMSATSVALATTIESAIAAPSMPDLIAELDSGVSNTDNITNVTKPTFTGTAAAGSTVTLYDGVVALGTAVATVTGAWSIATTSALANGGHSITAKAADVAGNVSVASGTLSISIDAVAPAPPAPPNLVATSDSGRSSTDNITNVATPTFTGTAEAGSTVDLARWHDGDRHRRRDGREVDRRRLDLGERRTQPKRQGDRCGGQRECRLGCAVGRHRQAGAECASVHRPHFDLGVNRDCLRHWGGGQDGSDTERNHDHRYDDGGHGRKVELELHQRILQHIAGPYRGGVGRCGQREWYQRYRATWDGRCQHTHQHGRQRRVLWRGRRRHLRVLFAVRAGCHRRLRGPGHSARQDRLQRQLGPEQLHERDEPRHAGWLRCGDRHGRQQYVDA